MPDVFVYPYYDGSDSGGYYPRWKLNNVDLSEDEPVEIIDSQHNLLVNGKVHLVVHSYKGHGGMSESYSSTELFVSCKMLTVDVLIPIVLGSSQWKMRRTF